MAKNWVKVKTVNDNVNSIEGSKVDRNLNHLINITPQFSSFELKKAQEELYKSEKIKEDNLIAAYNDKKLKSKRLIKKVQGILAARKRAKEKKKEKVEVSED